MSHMARIGFSLIWLICFNTCNHRNWFSRLLFLFYSMFEQSQSMADRLALCQRCLLYIGVSLSLLEGTSIDLCSPAELNRLNKRDCLDRGGGRGHKSGLGDTCCWHSICAHMYTTHTRLRKCLLRYVCCTFICACGSACCASVHLFMEACQDTVIHHSAELLCLDMFSLHVCDPWFSAQIHISPPKKHRWWRVVDAGRGWMWVQCLCVGAKHLLYDTLETTSHVI